MNINTLYRKTKNDEGLTAKEAREVYELLVSYDREIAELMKRISAISRVVDGIAPDWKNTRYGGRGELISADSVSLLEQIEWVANRATEFVTRQEFPVADGGGDGGGDEGEI